RMAVGHERGYWKDISFIRESTHTMTMASHSARRRRGDAGLDTGSYETYDIAMADMTVSEARDHFAEVVETARNEPVYLARHGRRTVVLVSAERYDALVEAQEHADDIAAAD